MRHRSTEMPLESKSQTLFNLSNLAILIARLNIMLSGAK